MDTVTLLVLFLVPMVVILWSVLNHPLAGTLVGSVLATPPLLGIVNLQDWAMLALGAGLVCLAVWLLYLWHLFFYPTLYGYRR